jgi:hypothetical protein
LQLQSGQRDKDILFPNIDITFTEAEIAAGHVYWGTTPEGLNWDEDIYGA